MFLIKPQQQEIIDGLEPWDWIDFEGKNPIAVTAFGDIFFDSSQGIFFLDTVSGQLDYVCQTKSDLEQLLNTRDGQDHYLMSELVLLARDNGLMLQDGQCYEFIIHPMLNGEIEISNLQVMDFKISLHITGQLVKQIKDLPVGTKISEIKLENT